MTDNTPNGTRQVHVAIVDDDPAGLRALEDLLAGERYQLALFTRGEQLLSAVHDVRPDVIVLDVRMPDMDGYEVCRRLKANAATCDIPVIFLSGLAEDEDIAAAFNAGGVDYVMKPVRQQELLARLTTQVRLHLAYKQLAGQHTRLRELETHRDTLVHMVAHDMRAPLQAILGHLQLLEHDALQKLGKPERESLNQALTSTRKLSRLVTEMIDVSRLENHRLPVNCQPVEFRPILESLISSVTGTGTGQSIDVRMPASCPPVLADPLLLERTLLNLIDNAAKYSPAGSVVTIHVEHDAGNVKICVQDQGDGIPDNQQAHVFEKFATFHQTTGATRISSGLGLAFCKLAVEQQGGTIGYTNLSEGGSRFWFTLPAASSAIGC
jgi:K+-sensing histidine kinase KdpD